MSFKRTVFKSLLSKSPFRDTTLIQAFQTSAGWAPCYWETLTMSSTRHVEPSNLCSKFLFPASLLSGSKPLVSRKKKKITRQCITYSFFKNKTISFGNNNKKSFPIHRTRCNSARVLWLESGAHQWSLPPLLRNWLYLFRECEDVHCGLQVWKGTLWTPPKGLILIKRKKLETDATELWYIQLQSQRDSVIVRLSRLCYISRLTIFLFSNLWK